MPTKAGTAPVAPNVATARPATAATTANRPPAAQRRPARARRRHAAQARPGHRGALQGGAGGAGCAAHSRRGGRRLRQRIRRELSPPCAGRMDVGDEVPGRGPARGRQRARQQRLHGLARCCGTRRQRDDPVPRGPRRGRQGRVAYGRTVVDMANGPVQRLRPFPETIALLEKLGGEEPASLRVLLGPKVLTGHPMMTGSR